MMKYTDLNAAFEAATESTQIILEVPITISADLEKSLLEHGFFVARIDRAKVFNKDTLMHALYQSCQFPAYFGFNFDALEECLNDLEWIQAKGIALVFHDFALFEERDPEDAKTFLEIMRDVSERRREDKVAPLKLILARA
jgi:RNAse (barnase) inhibitor barstar